MNLEKLWHKALEKTEIHRSRLNNLYTFQPTDLPYIFLAESSVNMGDTVVRKGRITVDKPLLILPKQYPLFEGFDFVKDLHINSKTVSSFLLMRGINLPYLKYQNKTYSIDIYEGSLKKAIEHHKKILEKKEDVQLGLIVGTDDLWQISLLIYVAAMVSKSAANDIDKFLKKLKDE